MSSAHLWSWVTLTALPANLHKIPAALTLTRQRLFLSWLKVKVNVLCCRLAAVNTMHMSVVSSQLLKAVAEHKGLRKLVMIETKLTEVPANLLAHVVANKREVNLGASDLTDQQVKAIVEALKPNSPLSTLTLKSVNLSSLEVDSLALLLNPLQDLNICNCQLRPSQVNWIFMEILNRKGKFTVEKMKIVNERYSSLIIISPGFLCLQTVRLFQGLCSSRLG